MIKETFKLRPSNQHLELVNPRVADLTDIFAIGPGQAYMKLIMTFDLDENLG